MGVPRCKKKKGGKTHKQTKVEAKFKRIVDEMETEAVMNASQYAQLLLYFALERKFGFGVKRIGEVQNEINHIQEEILHGDYDLDWVEEHFKAKGIVIIA